MSSLLSWIRSFKTHHWWHFSLLIEYNKSWKLAWSLSLLLIILLSRDTYYRKASCQARFEILVLFSQTNEILKRLACLNWTSSRVFISTFWLNLSTQVKSHDSTRYQSRAELELADLTRLVKQSNMTSRELNIEKNFDFMLLHYLFALPFW